MRKLRGEGPSIDALCAMLVKEPFNLTISEIGALTPYQIKNIYFRDADADQQAPPPEGIPGLVEPSKRAPTSGKRMSPKDVFYSVGTARNMTTEQIDAAWPAYARKNKLQP